MIAEIHHSHMHGITLLIIQQKQPDWWLLVLIRADKHSEVAHRSHARTQKDEDLGRNFSVSFRVFGG
jgi:hypothetical protein